jgi:hypothetical protein
MREGRLVKWALILKNRVAVVEVSSVAGLGDWEVTCCRTMDNLSEECRYDKHTKQAAMH